MAGNYVISILLFNRAMELPFTIAAVLTLLAAVLYNTDWGEGAVEGFAESSAEDARVAKSKVT